MECNERSKIWDAHTGDSLNTWTDNGSAEMFAQFTDMGLLASAVQNGIRIWNSSNSKMLATFQDRSVFPKVAFPKGCLALINLIE